MTFINTLWIIILVHLILCVPNEFTLKESEMRIADRSKNPVFDF